MDGGLGSSHIPGKYLKSQCHKVKMDAQVTGTLRTK